MRAKLFLVLVFLLVMPRAASFDPDTDWDNDNDHDYGDAADYHQTYDWSDRGSCRDANGTNWQYSRNERSFENDVCGDTLTVREIHAVPDVDCRSYSEKSAAYEISGSMRDNPNSITFDGPREIHVRSIEHTRPDRDSSSDRSDSSVREVSRSDVSTSSLSSSWDSCSSGASAGDRMDGQSAQRDSGSAESKGGSQNRAPVSWYDEPNRLIKRWDFPQPVYKIAPEDPTDERLTTPRLRKFELAKLWTVPSQPYVGHGEIACLKSYGGFPLFLDAFKRYKTFEEFKAYVYQEAEKIRKNPRYLRDSIKDYGVERDCSWGLGLIGSHKDYSRAHKAIFALEADLRAMQVAEEAASKKRAEEKPKMLATLQSQLAQVLGNAVLRSEFGVDINLEKQRDGVVMGTRLEDAPLKSRIDFYGVYWPASGIFDTGMSNCREVVLQLRNLAQLQSDQNIASDLVAISKYLIAMLSMIKDRMNGNGAMYGGESFHDVAALANTITLASGEPLVDDLTACFNEARTIFIPRFMEALEQHPKREELLNQLDAVTQQCYKSPADVVAVGLQIFDPAAGTEPLMSLPTYGKFMDAVQAVHDSDPEHKLEREVALACFYPMAQLVEAAAEQAVQASGLREARKKAEEEKAWADFVAQEPPGDPGPDERTFFNVAYLEQLSDSYRSWSADLCDSSYGSYGMAYAEIMQKRAAVVALAAENPDEIIERSYAIDLPLVVDYPGLMEMRDSRGNLAQLRLRDELHTNLGRVGDLVKNYKNDFCVQNSVPLILQMSALALEQDDPYVAFNLAETCHHLVSIARIIAPGVWASAKGLMYVGKGLYKGGKMYANHLVDFVKHPINTIASDITAPFALAKAAYCAAYVAAFGEHEEREKLWGHVKDIAGHFYENPDDIVAAGMQVFMPVPTFVVLGRVVAAAKVVNIKKVVQATKSFIKSTPQQQAAVLQALNPAAAVVEAGAQHVVQTYANLCEEVYATCKELPTNKRLWEHIFKWEYAKGRRPKGFHFEGSYQGKLVDNLILASDNLGVYAGFYKEGDWCKFSTFFPKNWTRMDVKNKLIESFRNPIQKELDAVIGKTSEGILVKVVFARENGRPVVVSAYPFYKNDGCAMNHIKVLGQNKQFFKI